MKVNPKLELYLRHIEPRPAAKRDTPALPDTGVQGDSIAISTTARLLQAALEMEEPFAADKVQRLQHALAQGQYEVDSMRLAGALAGDILQARGKTV